MVVRIRRAVAGVDGGSEEDGSEGALGVEEPAGEDSKLMILTRLLMKTGCRIGEVCGRYLTTSTQTACRSSQITVVQSPELAVVLAVVLKVWQARFEAVLRSTVALSRR